MKIFAQKTKNSPKSFFERQKSKTLFQRFNENFSINPKKNPLIAPLGLLGKKLHSQFIDFTFYKRGNLILTKIESLTLKIQKTFS